MVKNLVEKGQLDKPLILYNRTTAKSEKTASGLPEGKTRVAKSIDEAVEPSDIIYICLGDDPAVESTIESMVKVGIKGKLIVDCSTIHPDTTTKIAEQIQQAGGEFVAGPVFGAPAAAEAGKLICIFAGPKSSVQKVIQYGEGVMGRANIDYSDQPWKSATTFKIIGNSVILNMVESVSTGHVMAEKAGLGTDNLHTFIELMVPVFAPYSTRMLSGQYFKREEPLFGVDLARKDLRHVRSLGKTYGVPIRAVEVADGHLAMVQEHMGSRGDLSGIYGAVRQESGLKFENS